MKREDFHLQPVEERDLQLILSWRNSERIRAYMYSDHLITPEEHRVWFEKLKQDQRDIFFLVFYYQTHPVGIVQFNNIDNQIKKCEWGFYIGEENVPKGTGAVMGLLGLEYIFEKHHIHKVYGESFVFNQPSIKFHSKLGFQQEALFQKHVLKNGKYEDVIVFGLLRENWLKQKSTLVKNIF